MGHKSHRPCGPGKPDMHALASAAIVAVCLLAAGPTLTEGQSYNICVAAQPLADANDVAIDKIDCPATTPTDLVLSEGSVAECRSFEQGAGQSACFPINLGTSGLMSIQVVCVDTGNTTSAWTLVPYPDTLCEGTPFVLELCGAETSGCQNCSEYASFLSVHCSHASWLAAGNFTIGTATGPGEDGGAAENDTDSDAGTPDTDEDTDEDTGEDTGEDTDEDTDTDADADPPTISGDIPHNDWYLGALVAAGVINVCLSLMAWRPFTALGFSAIIALHTILLVCRTHAFENYTPDWCDDISNHDARELAAAAAAIMILLVPHTVFILKGCESQSADWITEFVFLAGAAISTVLATFVPDEYEWLALVFAGVWAVAYMSQWTRCKSTVEIPELGLGVTIVTAAAAAACLTWPLRIDLGLTAADSEDRMLAALGYGFWLAATAICLVMATAPAPPPAYQSMSTM